jgi:hypothetical protein
MVRNRARKLAESLLASADELDPFEVDVWSTEEGQEVADELTRLGCQVEIDRFKPRLTVTRPPQGARI